MPLTKPLLSESVPEPGVATLTYNSWVDEIAEGSPRWVKGGELDFLAGRIAMLLCTSEGKAHFYVLPKRPDIVRDGRPKPWRDDPKTLTRQRIVELFTNGELHTMDADELFGGVDMLVYQRGGPTRIGKRVDDWLRAELEIN